jgi:hypothetical protein
MVYALPASLRRYWYWLDFRRLQVATEQRWSFTASIHRILSLSAMALSISSCGLIHGTAILLAAGLIACSRSNDRRSTPHDAQHISTLVATAFEHIDTNAREPMIVEHPDGSLFVSGYGAPTPSVWKSRDGGATWSRLNTGSAAAGDVYNSDVDLAVGKDGTVYLAQMIFDVKKLEGVSVSVAVSRDVGRTWTWTLLSETRFDDRPWIEVAADGTVHVIWNNGSGISHASSNDAGRTWKTLPKILVAGGSSHLATGPKGEIAVRITPLSASGLEFDQGVDFIAVSADGGVTWQQYPAPGQREWQAMADTSVTPPKFIEPDLPRWVEPLAWDAADNLYSFWTNQEGLWLARSADRGARWTMWQLAHNQDVPHFPYLIARGSGELAATWFSGHADTLQAHIARIDIGDASSPPRMIESAPVVLDVWERGDRPSDPLTRDSAGEYLALAFLRNGSLAMVSPIQNPTVKRFGFTYWTIEQR